MFGDVRLSRVPAKFSGTRAELFWRLVGGYLLMVPTLGLYRFWVTTMKRQFYWHHTSIDGDALEYTGTPVQLLIGFLIALAVFLPLYIAFFYLSTQVGTVVVVGYGVVAALFWFLFGYASYRGRDFRLSRTLWRGIRFDQKGNAWAYATRQFLWSLLVVVTAGLAYPFMSADLWRYRYTNTWYGDRQFSFTGSWRTIAGPFYRAYATVAILVGAALGVGFLTEGRALALVPLLAIILGFGGFFYYRAREAACSPRSAWAPRASASKSRRGLWPSSSPPIPVCCWWGSSSSASSASSLAWWCRASSISPLWPVSPGPVGSAWRWRSAATW